MEAMQLHTESGQVKSAPPIFELDATEIEAVSGGATLVSVTPYAHSQNMLSENGIAGYYQIDKYTYSDGSVVYKTSFVQYV